MADRIVTIEVEDVVPYDLGNGDDRIEMPVSKFMELLAAGLDRVPPEFRDAAVLCVRATGDYASAYVSMNYDRPETDGERRAREQQSTRYQTEREASERQEYARLKAKFEGGTDTAQK